MNWLFLMLLSTQAFFVPQVRLNDCGTASMLMVARHYEQGMEMGSRELQDQITDGEDRALHFTELVWYSEQMFGVELQITYTVNDLIEEQREGEPVIFLLKDEVHYVVMHEFNIYDPQKGVTSWEGTPYYDFIVEYLDQHDWVAFTVE